jgi:hypothetical protein
VVFLGLPMKPNHSHSIKSAELPRYEQEKPNGRDAQIFAKEREVDLVFKAKMVAIRMPAVTSSCILISKRNRQETKTMDEQVDETLVRERLLALL